MHLSTLCQALLIFKVPEAPGEESQYIIMHWMTDHAYILLLLMLLVVLLMEPLLKRIQVVRGGGEKMGRHLVLTLRKKMHLIFLRMILMMI